MGQEIVYCFKCASRLLGADFDKGKAFRFEGKSICRPCLQALLPTLPPDQRDLLSQTMEEYAKKKASGASLPAIRPGSRPTESTRKIKMIEAAGASAPPNRSKAPLVVGLVTALAALGIGAAILSRPAAPSPPPAARVVDSEAPTPDTSRPPKPEANLAAELSELDGQVRSLVARESFRQAADLIEAARKRHRDRDWTDVIDRRVHQVHEDAQKLLAPLKEKAVDAQRRNVAAEVAPLRARVARWGLDALVEEFDRALAVATPPPPPPPPPAADLPPLVAYADGLALGWTDWSWGSGVEYKNTDPVFEGTHSIAFTPRQASAGLFLHSDAVVSTAEYAYVAFATQAARPDVTFSMQLYDENNKPVGRSVPLAELGGVPPVGTWKRYVVSATQLNAAKRNVRGIIFMALQGAETPALYVDSVSLLKTAPKGTAAPPPPPPPKSGKYQARWSKAMDYAAVRDFEAALRELDDPDKNAQEAVGRSEVTYDIDTLRSVQGLHDRAVQALARWPRGVNVELTTVDEPGKPLRLDEPALRVEATRLDVRRDKGTLTVEFGEILPGALVEILRKAPSDPSPTVEARAAALFCLIEGDLEGAERQNGGRVPDKYVERARQASESRSAPREVEARRLLGRANAALGAYATRTDASALLRQLLAQYADTAVVRRNRASLLARDDAAKDYFFGPGDLEGGGAFRPARHAEGRLGWTCDEDAKDKARRRETFVELEFSALADVPYQAWVYAGACCQETFEFALAGTELAETPVPVTLPLLPRTHAGHSTRRKEPSRWEWIALSLPKYATPGAKKVQVLSDQQGFTVVWAVVSAVRKAPPKEPEARELERGRPALRTLAAPAVVTGKILYERWAGIPGVQVANLTGHASFLQAAPDKRILLSSFEAPSNAADDYGTRIRGYVHPPQTGAYTFWLAGDDHTELWLSPGEDPAKKTKIAFHAGVTGVREWGKSPNQKSAPVALAKGRRYYVEVLHKEAKGPDHVAVAWQLPDGAQERPIPGPRLSPFVPGSLQPGAVITSPSDGSLFTAGSTVTVTADYYGGLPSRADVLVASRKQGDARTEPLTFTWQNVPPGSYPLSFRVVDKSGETVYSNPVTIRVGEISFYRGINLNGPPVTIDGNPWEGRGAAQYATSGHGFEREDAELRPPADPERAAMVRASVTGRGGTSVTLSAVPPGTYLVYLYVWEDGEPETFDVLVNGKAVVSAHSSGQAGRWDRLGPWTQEVKDGKIEVRSAGGGANFSGVEVWKLGAGPEVKAPARTPAVGGEGGTPFEELAGERGLLSGLKLWYGTYENRRVVRAVQPVYLKDGVRSEGEIHGKVTATAVEVSAKPGYVVAGLVARSSARVDGFRVVFMKVAGGRLQPGERYESDWFGGPGGGAETVLAADGSAVVGLHGRKGDDIDALGLVFLK